MRKDYRNRRLEDLIVLARERIQRLFQRGIKLQKQVATNYFHQQIADLTKDDTRFHQRRGAKMVDQEPGLTTYQWIIKGFIRLNLKLPLEEIGQNHSA